MRETTTWSRCAGIIGLAFGLAMAAAPAQADYMLETTIAVPPSADNNAGGKFTAFDISFFDPSTQLNYVADRTNAAVDIFSGVTESFVGRVGGSIPRQFEGNTGNSDTSGPDGVLTASFTTRSGTQHQLWAGDGNSTVKAFDINHNYAPIPPTTASVNSGINTAGTKRVDEGAFNPSNHTVLFANDADTPPFLTLVDAATNAILKKITLNGSNHTPNATGGIEQPVWDSASRKFYVSIPQIGGGSDPGGILELDAAGNVIKTFDLASFGISSCGPTGLSVGKHSVLGVNCGNAHSQTILFNPTAHAGAGAVVKTFTQFSGGDEDWYDPGTGDFFFAAQRNASGPVVGIIDGNNDKLLQEVATSAGAHSVSVDPVTGDIFVPFGGIAGNTTCPNGCIAVFANSAATVPEPSSLLLLAGSSLMLIGFGWRRRRFGAMPGA